MGPSTSAHPGVGRLSRTCWEAISRSWSSLAIDSGSATAAYHLRTDRGQAVLSSLLLLLLTLPPPPQGTNEKTRLELRVARGEEALDVTPTMPLAEELRVLAAGAVRGAALLAGIDRDERTARDDEPLAELAAEQAPAGGPEDPRCTCGAAGPSWC